MSDDSVEARRSALSLRQQQLAEAAQASSLKERRYSRWLSAGLVVVMAFLVVAIVAPYTGNAWLPQLSAWAMSAVYGVFMCLVVLYFVLVRRRAEAVRQQRQQALAIELEQALIDAESRRPTSPREPEA